ncbi:hypothetical protein BN1708_000295, partial [Verticillium longisporum]
MTMPPHVRISSFISVPCDEDMFTLPPRLNIIPAVSRNPFSTAYYRAQELAFEQADAPYRTYQLACYAVRPPRPPTTWRTVPATAEQRLAPKRRDGKSPWCAMTLVLRLLLGLPFACWMLVSRAGAELGCNVIRAADDLCFWYRLHVHALWLAWRPTRGFLLGSIVKAACAVMLLHHAYCKLIEADDGPRYVLVHECRMWSGPFKA